MYRVIMPYAHLGKSTYVTTGEGDPPRTYFSTNAKKFKIKKNAQKFLAKLQKEYPNRLFEIEEF